MDEVWITTKNNNQAMRRIVNYLDDWVFYSDGGDKTKACTLAEFKLWIAKTEARLFNESDRK